MDIRNARGSHISPGIYTKEVDYAAGYSYKSINKRSRSYGGNGSGSGSGGGGGHDGQDMDYAKMPLTFEILSDGVINWVASYSGFTKTIEYSKDNGVSWESITSSVEGSVIPVRTNDVIIFRGNNHTYGGYDRYVANDGVVRYEWNGFSGTTCQFKVKGNIMSTTEWDIYQSLYDFKDWQVQDGNTTYFYYSVHVFESFFTCCEKLTDACNLVLPVTALTSSCYENMFKGCVSLAAPPKLPATVLAPFCYSGMFSGCESLLSAPYLSVKTMELCCYRGMFQGCTSLTAAPELPATVLAHGCYDTMFSGCKLLTTAPELPATILDSACYARMFQGCTSLTAAPELPATVLAHGCYDTMFRDCRSLSIAPVLPATTITEFCYNQMFYGCTALTLSPELPATISETCCYQLMFCGCTSLIAAPELPATTLADCCYYGMFQSCTGLTTPPSVLPATTLADTCYYGMFQNCMSLTSAPELPATTLEQSCYAYMFQGCANINHIKCLAIDISATDSLNYWVLDVAPVGLFVKASSMSSWPIGANGIPEGWIVENYGEEGDVDEECELSFIGLEEPPILDFPLNGGTLTLSFLSSCDWTASVESGWVKMKDISSNTWKTTLSGPSGTTEIIISATSVPLLEEREINIVFNTNNNTKNVLARQISLPPEIHLTSDKNVIGVGETCAVSIIITSKDLLDDLWYSVGYNWSSENAIDYQYGNGISLGMTEGTIKQGQVRTITVRNITVLSGEITLTVSLFPRIHLYENPPLSSASITFTLGS